MHRGNTQSSLPAATLEFDFKKLTPIGDFRREIYSAVALLSSNSAREESNSTSWHAPIRGAALNPSPPNSASPTRNISFWRARNRPICVVTVRKLGIRAVAAKSADLSATEFWNRAQILLRSRIQAGGSGLIPRGGYGLATWRVLRLGMTLVCIRGIDVELWRQQASVLEFRFDSCFCRR